MTDAASPWPRHARLWSVLILAVGVLMGAGGEPAYPPWVLPVAIGIAVVMFLLARSDVAGPVGVAMLGGGMVGTMVGNLRAISRHGG